MRDLERARQKAAHNAAKRAAGGATDAGSVIAQERRAADVARTRFSTTTTLYNTLILQQSYL